MKLSEKNNVNRYKHGNVETNPVHRCPMDFASNTAECVNDAKL